MTSPPSPPIACTPKTTAAHGISTIPIASARSSARWTTICWSRARICELYRRLGAHLMTHEGVEGVHFAVWAPQRAARLGGRRLQRLGRPPPSDAQARRQRPVGNLRPRHRRGRGLQIRDLSASRRLHAAEGRSLRLCRRIAARRPPRSSPRTDNFAWTDADYLAARARSDPRRAPMSIYEVHLGSWRRGEGNRFLTYDELADSLIPYVARSGLHPSRTAAGHRASARRLLGLSADRPVRADLALRRSRRLRPLRRSRPRAGLGVILDWVPAHFPTDAHGLARFDGEPALRACRSAAGLSSRLEHRDLRFRPPRGRQFPRRQRAVLARAFHIDGLRVDAVASMLYLDYSRRKPANGCPTPMAATRISKPSPSCDRSTRWSMALSRRGDDRRGIDRLARRVATRPCRRPGLRLQMEHGLDARHAALYGAGPGPSPLAPRPADLRPALRLFARISSCRCPMTRSCMARARSSAGCPATTGRNSPTCAPITPSCGAIPARSCCSWARSSARPREWSEIRSLDWHLLQYPPHAGLSLLVRDLNRLYRDTTGPACARLRGRGLSNGSWSTTPTSRSSPGCGAAGRKIRPVAVVVNFTPVPRADYRIGLPPPAAGAKSSTPMPQPITAAPASAISARFEAIAEPSRGQPASAGSRCRRSPRSISCSNRKAARDV